LLGLGRLLLQDCLHLLGLGSAILGMFYENHIAEKS
jgi:hypothetical protein